MPWQLNPGKQQPPFDEFGHAEYPLEVSQLTAPAHVWPSGQQPTDPASELPLTLIHVLPDPQQTSGAPISEQLFVPSGHLNCLFSSTCVICKRARKSSWVTGRNGDLTCTVPFPQSSSSSKLVNDGSSTSEANIQFSNMNISPASRLIFLTPMGTSCCSRCFTLRLRLACISSSGKYFMCRGRLCGHCGSAVEGVAQRSVRMAGGSDNRFARCIVAIQDVSSRNM